MEADAARPLGKAEDACRGDPCVAARWVAVEKGVPTRVKHLRACRLCEHHGTRWTAIRNARGRRSSAQRRAFRHTEGSEPRVV